MYLIKVNEKKSQDGNLKIIDICAKSIEISSK
jgi:hypothetical protein